MRLFSATIVLVFTAHALSAQTAAPLSVVVSPVERVEEFGDEVQSLGTTRADESVEITSNVAEAVEGIFFDDGDSVTRGQVLVRLRQDEEQAALKAAEARLDERRAAYERAETLEERRALSTATLRERQALLSQIEGEIEAIQSRIDDRVIRAPFDGVLGLREVSLGALVRPGDRVTTLDDLRRIKVDFDVPANVLGALRTGLPIKGRVDAYPDRVFEGEVTTVSPRVNPATRTVTARAVLPNPDGLLRPGMLMRVTLRKNPREALIAPEAGIIQRGETFSVLAVEKSADGPVARMRKVSVGERVPGGIEVTAGLAEGDQIVVHGLMRVGDGDSVKVVGEKTGGQTLTELLGEKAPNRRGDDS